MGRLNGKRALITGGNSGIGFATARLFVQEGAAVTITGRRLERGKAAAQELGAKFIQADVRNPDDCERVATASGPIDILFNNAGVVIFGDTLSTSLEDWRTTWETNVSGIFYMCRAVLPGMIERGHGVIVNNGSDWSVVGGRDAVAYCASKGAVANMTRAIALDHVRQGIRVNAVGPGDTYVERWDAQFETDNPEDIAAQVKEEAQGLPMGRVATVDEIAQAVLFLASDAASYVNGQILVVDGGHTAGGTAERFS